MMRTYIVNGMEFQAENKEDLRKKVHAKLTPGVYSVYSKNGTNLYDLATTERAMKKRPTLPKEQYDQLYYYVPPSYVGSDHPMWGAHRRYDTLVEARKYALAKCNANYPKVKHEIEWWGRAESSTTMAVYKGFKLLGYVDTVKGGPKVGFDGLWAPIEHPKDPQPLLSDGTIGSRPAKRR